jgi:hypothetical protein
MGGRLMQQMRKEELEGVLHDIAQNVGAAMPHPESIGNLLGRIGGDEKRGDISVPGTLRRLRQTIRGLCRSYPHIKPNSDRPGKIPGGLPREEDIAVSLGEIRDIVPGISYWMATQIDNAERHLRRLLSGRGEPCKKGRIEIVGFDISEKCLGGCRGTCGISARAGDPQMPWELFEGALDSEGIYIDPSKVIWLGDGEVLLYPKLFEAVERLIKDCGYKVKFTTAGLIPQNRERGIEFFRKLQELGAYASDLKITISFNLLFGFIRNEADVGKYMGCIEETLHWIRQGGAHLRHALLLVPEQDELGTLEAYKRMEPGITGMYGFSEMQCRNGILRVGDALEFGKGTREDKSTQCEHMKSWGQGLRSNGSITTGCRGFGKRSSRIGNLAANGMGQMRELIAEHNRRFFKDIVRGGKGKCYLHQRWKRGRLAAPKSDNPVIRLKRAIRRRA